MNYYTIKGIFQPLYRYSRFNNAWVLLEGEVPPQMLVDYGFNNFIYSKCQNTYYDYKLNKQVVRPEINTCISFITVERLRHITCTDANDKDIALYVNGKLITDPLSLFCTKCPNRLKCLLKPQDRFGVWDDNCKPQWIDGTSDLRTIEKLTSQNVSNADDKPQAVLSALLNRSCVSPQAMSVCDRVYMPLSKASGTPGFHLKSVSQDCVNFKSTATTSSKRAVETKKQRKLYCSSCVFARNNKYHRCTRHWQNCWDNKGRVAKSHLTAEMVDAMTAECIKNLGGMKAVKSMLQMCSGTFKMGRRPMVVALPNVDNTMTYKDDSFLIMPSNFPRVSDRTSYQPIVMAKSDIVIQSSFGLCDAPLSDEDAKTFVWFMMYCVEKDGSLKKMLQSSLSYESHIYYFQQLHCGDIITSKSHHLRLSYSNFSTFAANFNFRYLPHSNKWFKE